jgi:hypothetical protein
LWYSSEEKGGLAMKPGYRVILAIIITSFILFSTIPRETVAIPFKVQGYLKDSDGLPVTLAKVTFTGQIYDPGVQDYIDITLNATTDANGYFKIYLAAMEPGGFDQNSIVTVAYTTEGQVVSQEITIQGLGAWTNLTYKEKPNLVTILFSPVGLISIVALASAIFIGYYLYHTSRKDSHNENKDQKPTPKRVERRRNR